MTLSSSNEQSGLVTVHLATSEFEAQTVAAVLRDREIEAVVFSAAISAFGLDGVGNRMLGGIPVQVRACDLERATAALRANKFLSDSVDWDAVEVGDEDPQAKALASQGPFMSYGRFMVKAGKYSLVALLLTQIIIGIARCM